MCKQTLIIIFKILKKFQLLMKIYILNIVKQKEERHMYIIIIDQQKHEEKQQK